MNALRLSLRTCGPRASLAWLLAFFSLSVLVASPSFAIDLIAFTGITGPLTSALTQLAALTPGFKALIGVITFTVSLIALSVLRDFGPVLKFFGVAIFAATGLVIGGAIMGMCI
ncbi:hypothetical protein E4L96_19990 [Massilia arenosa]|uniref:Uncharacterized protein n=1 Tax=Zemynaea arenosa TaxID=2561931 RepID=A0A4Y9RW59_9BURK|nr:hypothetical protein [Massilia arenosa]TFW13380.1 hypothetical protein E4L96_19990 [Massilia arenosa]